MADTTFLVEIEEHVRAMLTAKHAISFTKQHLELPGGGLHEFDAVSVDRRFVASIKTASGRTSGGRVPSAKIKDCIAELYFLTLINAPHRMLILTTPEFYEIFRRTMVGRLAPGLEILHVPLPEQMQTKVASVQATASREMARALMDGNGRGGLLHGGELTNFVGERQVSDIVPPREAT